MKNKKENDGSTLLLKPNVLLLFFMAVLLAFFLMFVYETDRKDIANIADETINFMESVCQRYDGYAKGQYASTLKNIFDKAEGLRELTTEKSLENDAFLLKFAKAQSLTGILITDGNLKAVGQADVNGRNAFQIWKEFISESNKKDILINKKKTFSGTTVVKRKSYDVVIVSRQDKDGIILCYADNTAASTDIYEVSMEKTLTNNTFHKNPKIVITDGRNIIATNTDVLDGKSLAVEAPITDTNGDRWKDGSLIHLQWEGESWYGKRQVYENYIIYVFYPGSEVFTNMLPVVTTAIAIYALLCLFVEVFRYNVDKKHFEEERKQLNTIKAVSTLYIATSVLHLRKRTFEGISVPERSQKILDETDDADKVGRLLAERIIMPEHRKAYIEFLDFDTIPERIKGKVSLSDMFMDVDGVWFATYLVPMEYDASGNVTEVLFLSRNINDYKQNEEQYKEELRRIAREAELASAAKTSFLQRMSHDIRTPINGIKGMAAIAGKSLNKPERAKESIDKIIVSADYLYSLLDDILRMSKLETGEVFFEEKAFDMREVLEETNAFIAERAREKQIDFSCDIEEIVHTHVIGSPLHFRQVIQNIMSNAVKFNRVGGQIEVIGREIEESEGKAEYEFVCTDTGIGISPEFQERIFDLFAQEGDSARTDYEGSGLGLPIAKELLEKRGGRITFQSEKGIGSTFIINVPLKVDEEFREENEKAYTENKAQNLESAQLKAKELKNEESEVKESETKEPEINKLLEDAENSIQGVRILLVEDNVINMEIAKCLLEEKEAVITEAHNGKEAVDIFSSSEEYAFDAILMDIMMPEMNGLNATKAIRNLKRADAADIPIFAMTANAFMEDIKKCKEAGMNEHFAKPLDMKKIVRTIHKYCEEVHEK